MATHRFSGLIRHLCFGAWDSLGQISNKSCNLGNSTRPGILRGCTALPTEFFCECKVCPSGYAGMDRGASKSENPSKSASGQPAQPFRGHLLDNAGAFPAIPAHEARREIPGSALQDLESHGRHSPAMEARILLKLSAGLRDPPQVGRYCRVRCIADPAPVTELTAKESKRRNGHVRAEG